MYSVLVSIEGKSYTSIIYFHIFFSKTCNAIFFLSFGYGINTNRIEVSERLSTWMNQNFHYQCCFTPHSSVELQVINNKSFSFPSCQLTPFMQKI